MNYEKMESKFDYDIVNLDTSKVKEYLEKINLYDLPYMPSNILSQLKGKEEMENLFKTKLEKILQEINELKFNDLSILYIKIGKICNNLMNYNCYFDNYEKSTNNFFTFKKLLILISYKIIKDKKDLMMDGLRLIDIIKGYLKYKKTNKGGNYILYNSLLNNIFNKYSINMYCSTAIDFCIENIDSLDNYNQINYFINKTIIKINGNYCYNYANQPVESSDKIVNILEYDTKKEYINQYTNERFDSKKEDINQYSNERFDSKKRTINPIY